ncbi:tetratricopeptide repeat protein [Streptomyces cinnabarinus]|uniref:Tetratricopeptide repeat protein n=1 Tax=Streptomyces cinnabarinus TaxID=67287 RepID=A0ABY7KGE1_9ACTN|nr:tetratricopeptide repeat protein [Streptomyces cinnabarinus]WAZ21791.1 tetratricopeptide repeat protein [Streptomyces cinnabarinus]
MLDPTVFEGVSVAGGAEDGDHIDFGGGVFKGSVTGKAEHHYYGARRPAVAWPHQVGVIPPRAGCFQSRAEVVRLREALTAGQAAVLVGQDVVRGQVLAGMGGVGKTQLAADYARTALWSGELDLLVWITASNATAAASGYAQAAVDILGADPADREAAARAFLAWLEPKANAAPCRWLVVLDDVSDPADLNGLWPPACPHGRTLVTTRRQDAALTGRLIKVGLFSEAESLAYLTAALDARNRHEPAEQLAALAEDLGHLPLALSQAAAYLIDAGISAAAYRELLADRATVLADAAPEVLPDGQSQSAAAAWSLSVDRADTLRPAGLARPMLQLAAFLNPNGIPETVLTSTPALTHLTQHRTETQDRTPEPVTAGEAVGALRALDRLSLISHNPANPHQAVRVHQLIQRATREALTPDEHDQLARTTASALTTAWPAIERDTELAQALRTNATALTRSAGDALYKPDAHAVLYRAGQSLGEAGQVTAAKDHFHRLAETFSHHLGPGHPSTLTARHSRAYWRGRAGDAAGAAAAFEQLLPDRVRVQGEDHAHTLNIRHNIAYWRGEAGDAAGAAAAFELLLSDSVRVLGEDHPDTLTIRSNIARWRGRAGDAAGAAAAYEQLLPDRVRVLGEGHPDTLTTRHELAYWRGMTGDAAGAAAAFELLLPDRVRVQGEDHPDTLTTRHELAYWRGMAGDAPGAAAALEQLLPDRVRVLGEDHPDTLTTRSNLARWRGTAGDAAGAAAALQQVLPDSLRVRGEGHPDILTTRHNIAYWRGKAGDAAGAAAAFEQLLPESVRVLGADHLDTLTARHELAYWRGRAGDAAGAAATFEQLLPDRVRVLGADHPNTLTTRHNLAYWRGMAGDAAGAAAAFEQLLPDRVRVQGEDHPDTLTARNNLAYWREKAEETHPAPEADGRRRSPQV